MIVCIEHNCQQLLPFLWGPVQSLELSSDFLVQTVVCSVPTFKGKKCFMEQMHIVGIALVYYSHLSPLQNTEGNLCFNDFVNGVSELTILEFFPSYLVRYTC